MLVFEERGKSEPLGARREPTININAVLKVICSQEKKNGMGKEKHFFTKNKTQTAVMNMTDKRIVRKN